MGIITGKAVPRRTFLRGLGATAVALPFLDAMVPGVRGAAKAPVRLAFLYVPNGIDMKNWNSPQEGAFAGEFPRVMKPLEAFRDDMLQIGNLTHNSGRALLDGAGDHGRCCGSYLTGIQVKKTTIDIKASVSCDQIVANKIGDETRFPRSSSAWKTRGRPATAIPATPAPTPTTWRGAARRSRCRRSSIRACCSNGCSARASILSPEETRPPRAGTAAAFSTSSPTTRRSCRPSLGPTDKRKLDEYLSSIREVERQLEKAEKDSIADRSRAWISPTACRPISPSTSS